MKKNLIEINNETGGIAVNLNNLDGQMTFFSHLIQDCEQYPEISAQYMKHGKLQKQLNAIYYLFHYQLEEIKKYNEKIHKLSSMEAIEKENTPDSKNQG